MVPDRKKWAQKEECEDPGWRHNLTNGRRSWVPERCMKKTTRTYPGVLSSEHPRLSSCKVWTDVIFCLISWSSSHLYVRKGSWDLVRCLDGRVCEIIKLIKALESLSPIEAPVSGSTTSCHLLCLTCDTYKQYLPQENKQTKEPWEVPYPISVLFFYMYLFSLCFPRL